MFLYLGQPERFGCRCFSLVEMFKACINKKGLFKVFLCFCGNFSRREKQLIILLLVFIKSVVKNGEYFFCIFLKEISRDLYAIFIVLPF